MMPRPSTCENPWCPATFEYLLWLSQLPVKIKDGQLPVKIHDDQLTVKIHDEQLPVKIHEESYLWKSMIDD
jgi:hypothetical protein